MRLIDFGPQYGVVSFPDDATNEDIVANYDSLVSRNQPPPRQADLTPVDYIKNAAGGLVRGLGETLASIPEGVQTAREAVVNLAPRLLRPVAQAATLSPLDILSEVTGGVVPSASRLLRGTASDIRRATKAVAGEPVKGLEQSFLATKVPEGIGSSLSFLLGGVAGKALKIPQWLGTASLGSLSSGAGFYDDAKRSGADDRTAHIASLLGNVVGTSEALGAGRVLRHLDKLTGNTFTKSLIEAGKDSLEEAAQEAFQATAQNLTAKKLYDEDRELFNSVAENAGVGGFTGFLLSGLSQLAGIPARNRYMQEGVRRRREVIKDYAERTGTPLTTTGQEEGTQPQAAGGLRLRNTPQDGMEAETGAPLERVLASKRRLGAIPEWIPSDLRVKLGVADKQGSPIKVDITDEWSALSPAQKQNLLDEGWSVTSDRNNRVLIGHTTDVGPNRLREKVSPSTLESRAPSIRLPIQIQQADGTVIPGEFTGYTDQSAIGLGVMTSVGRQLPDGRMSHGLLKPGEKIIGDVPSFEEWKTDVQQRVASEPSQVSTDPNWVSTVNRIVEQVASRWSNSPSIQVVPDSKSLPLHVRRLLWAKNAGEVSTKDEAVAIPSRNEVWIIAGNIGDENTVKNVVLHEAIGHIGVNNVFGGPSQYNAFMSSVNQRHQNTELGTRIRELYGDDPITVGEEIVAKLAENPQIDLTLWQRIVAAVRSWVRRVFNIDVTDNDIRYLLRKSRSNLEGGSTLQSGPSPIGTFQASNATIIAPWLRGQMALTAHHGTPHRVDRFSTSKIGTGEGSQVYGWGLYFAENPDVARSYRDALTPRIPSEYVVRDENGREFGRFKTLAEAQQLIEDNERSRQRSYPERPPANLAAEAVVDLGREYTVSINAEPDELLDWDRPLADQSDKIQQAVASYVADRNRRVGDIPNPASVRGESIYVMLARDLPPAYQEKIGSRNIGTPKRIADNRAASAYLSSLGIKGIRYLDQGSRGMLNREDVELLNIDQWYSRKGEHVPKGWIGSDRVWFIDTRTNDEILSQPVSGFKNSTEAEQWFAKEYPRTYNYVIFNDSDIVITHENGTRIEAKQAVNTPEREERAMASRAPSSPQQFQTRQQVELAVADPLLKPAQAVIARDLAKVQSSMTSDEIMGWLMAKDIDDADSFAKKKLDYLQDRRFISDTKEWLKNLPATTDEEKQAKEVASSTILGHYGLDREKEAEINSELGIDQAEMAKKVKKLSTLNTQKVKSQFLSALFKHLTTDYKNYLANLVKAEPANATIASQYRENLHKAEQRLNDQEQSPKAIENALQAIAVGITQSELDNATSNQDIINWTIQNGMLNTVVSQDVIDWMLTDKGNGHPALTGYTRLIPDLKILKALLADQQGVANDIKAFEQWFSNTGKEVKVSPKAFAERYFKFRTARDRAAKVIAAIEGDIGDLDTRIHGNMIARERLETLMGSKDYVDTVREASNSAHVVVRALYQGNTRTGLIERDKHEGLWTLKSPMTGAEFVVDLHPSSSQETENVKKLKEFAKDARDYAAKNAQSNPVLADSYGSLADYIDRFLVHPALNPSSGFIRSPWFDPLNIAPKTIKDTLERLGGRAVRQTVLDTYELDSVMRRIESLTNSSEFGYAKQTQAVIKAMKSHGWGADAFPTWDETVAERIIASGQNTLSSPYEVGDIIPGTNGIKVTAEDIAAVKMMKKWEDEVLKSAPKSVRDRIGDMDVTRKAIAFGKFTMARTAAPWVQPFMSQWAKAGTDAEKIALLKNPTLFRRIVLGYINEVNPEFTKMNPASPEVTTLFDIFRRITAREKIGVQFFNTWDDVLDFTANEMVSKNLAPDYATARNKAEKQIIDEVKAFIESFRTNVIGDKQENVWGSVPDAVISASTANNSFTMKRKHLAAPSTFYTYSPASDGSRLHYVGSLRSFLNLKVLQSYYEARKAMESKKAELEQKMKELTDAGMSRRQAKETVVKDTVRARKMNEIRFDYLELERALRLMEKTFQELERFEISTHEHYQHAGVAAAMNVFGTLKSMLLSGPQAVVTNFWSGTMLGPAVTHIQTGRLGAAFRDFVLSPHFFKTLFQRMSATFAGNPVASKLLKKHAPFWDWVAKQVTDAAADWSRVEQIAQASGMVSPYNLGAVLENKKELGTTLGRLEGEGTDDVGSHPAIDRLNKIMSSGAVRGPTEAIKATTPRWFDNLINYSLINAFNQETEYLKKMGWAAFKSREDIASRTGADYKDLSNPDNVLTPSDLGLSTSKALDRYQQWFAGLGSLDQVILDFYERTKGMTPEQRREESLIPSIADHASVALQYAGTTNVSTETNRPYLFKGKGSDGVFRNIAGTFMGWTVNMLKNFSKLLHSHSGDKQFASIQANMLAILTTTILFALSGAFNWEFGDELTKAAFGQSSPRIQPGNVINAAKEGDLSTAGLYLIQALINTVPIIAPEIGNAMGLAFTGRGSPFDLTSLNPILGWIYDTTQMPKRMLQTGDVMLPLADYARRWVPWSRFAINRLPLMRGLVDQQNAIKSLNASAPPGTEIKWGRRTSGGAVIYGPVNDEIQKLIASAYEAVAHGGSQEEVFRRRQDAIDAFVRSGRSPQDAAKAVDTALAAKEPVRVLTGKEMTPQEEARWVSRMTTGQKKDYNTAVAAWKLLGAVTGKDLDMVATRSGGGGGGSAIAGMTSPLGGAASIRSPLGVSPLVGFRGVRRRSGVRSARVGRLTRIRRSRSARSGLLRRTRRLRSPKITRRSYA